MSDKNIEHLMELAKTKLEEARKMTKAQAIRSLNDVGILTTKGEFKGAYRPLNQVIK